VFTVEDEKMHQKQIIFMGTSSNVLENRQTIAPNELSIGPSARWTVVDAELKIISKKTIGDEELASFFATRSNFPTPVAMPGPGQFGVLIGQAMVSGSVETKWRLSI
jgi:hypothetical protein